MAYTFADLKTKLQTQIGDSSLDTTVMGDAINYTIQNIFNSIEITLNSEYQSNTVATGANTLTTALPSNFQKITSLYITSPVGLARDLTNEFVSPKEFRQMFPSITTSNPLSSWTFWTGVEFSTLADQDYTVRIEYIKSVPILSDATDVPAIPEAFEELLMLGAKIRVYEQKEDFDYADQFQTRYADALEAFISRYSTGQVAGQFIIPGPRQSISRIR